MVGGLFVDFKNTSDLIRSIPYYQDDFTWCIHKAEFFPTILNFFAIAPLGIWLSLFFGFGYGWGLILFIMIQFDRKYDQRNNRDWHYTTLLITLPAVIGLGQRFHPISNQVRLFYGLMLLSMVVFMQICFVFVLHYLKIRVPRHQVATVEELVKYEYDLMGSYDVMSFIKHNEKVKYHLKSMIAIKN